MELAEICGGLLASVTEDLMAVSELPRQSMERTKRLERVMEVAQEPYASALRIACAASPINGRAAIAHWDVVCDKVQRGKLAWLLGMDTEHGRRYGERMEKRA